MLEESEGRMEQQIEDIIKEFVSEYENPYEELDWWCYTDEGGINIHNYNSADTNDFKVDLYPYDAEPDKCTYTVWDCIKTFNFNEYKRSK